MNTISIITTVYNKEGSVLDQLQRVFSFMKASKLAFEIIIVNDGSTDDSSKKIKQFTESLKGVDIKKVSVISYKQNKGKGYAIRKGIKIAKGKKILLLDADLDIDMKTVEFLLKESKRGHSVVIPSKYHSRSNIEFSILRKVLSKGFLLLNSLLISLPKGVSDVSCGAKIFDSSIIKLIEPYLSVNGFAIDSEILHYISKLGVQVKTTPFIADINTRDTSVTVGKVIEMFVDLIKISRNKQLDKRLSKYGLLNQPIV